MKTWIYSHRNHLPVPFILLVLIGVIVTGGGGFSISLFVAGWIIIIVGEALRVWSVGYAGASTRSLKLRAERLVTWGPYARTRNPIYMGNFLIGLGFCFVAGLWWIFPLYLVYFVVQYSAIISVEEDFLRGKFGEEYEAYMRRVPRFLPGRRSQSGTDPYRPAFQSSHLSGEYWTILGILAMGVLLGILKGVSYFR